jgi:hypothetical protein
MRGSICALQQGPDFTESADVMPGWHDIGAHSGANTTEFNNLSPGTGYQG